MTTLCKACYTIPPVSSDYTPKGTIQKVEDFELYTVGDAQCENVVIAVYDIFGFHPVTKKFADILSEQGFLVVMPDFFRGKPWDTADFPPKAGFEALISWIQTAGSFERCTADIKSTIEYLKKNGNAKRFGLVGFCWGAKICVQEVAINKEISGAALMHPSFVSNDDAEKSQAPILAIPTKDDPKMDEFFEIMKKKPFGDKCVHQRFDDMHHGFAAARGDWAVPEQAQRVREALQLSTNFFKSVF